MPLCARPTHLSLVSLLEPLAQADQAALLHRGELAQVALDVISIQFVSWREETAIQSRLAQPGGRRAVVSTHQVPYDLHRNCSEASFQQLEGGRERWGDTLPVIAARGRRQRMLYHNWITPPVSENTNLPFSPELLRQEL